MSKLESMQRYAERLLRRAEAEGEVTIRWAGETCRLGRSTLAHAHIREGVICVRRGLRPWKGTIRHEVAHLLPGGAGHRQSFTRALARLGDPYAIAALREYDISVHGARHRHRWIRGQKLDEEATARGLVVLYAAVCDRCGKRIGGPSE